MGGEAITDKETETGVPYQILTPRVDVEDNGAMGDDVNALVRVAEFATELAQVGLSKGVQAGLEGSPHWLRDVGIAMGAKAAGSVPVLLHQVLRGASNAHKAKALLEVAPQIAANYNKFPDEKKPDVDASAPEILRAWERLWETVTEDKKRRIIMAALVNAFDPETYEQGLTLRLFDLLERLDYAELHMLQNDFKDISFNWPGELLVKGTLARDQFDRLLEHGLILARGSAPKPSMSMTRNERENYHVTELGQRMQRLITEVSSTPSGPAK